MESVEKIEYGVWVTGIKVKDIEKIDDVVWVTGDNTIARTVSDWEDVLAIITANKGASICIEQNVHTDNGDIHRECLMAISESGGFTFTLYVSELSSDLMINYFNAQVYDRDTQWNEIVIHHIDNKDKHCICMIEVLADLFINGNDIEETKVMGVDGTELCEIGEYNGNTYLQSKVSLLAIPIRDIFEANILSNETE